MKKILLLFITLFLFLPLVSASTNTRERLAPDYGINKNLKLTEEEKRDNTVDIPYVDSNEKIYDFAELFDKAGINALYEKVKAFESKAEMDIAIVTIDKNRKTAKTFAYGFYDYNDFGMEYKNYSGLILLIDMANREVYIATDGNATLYYDDVRIELMLDDLYDYLKNGEYYQAATTFVESATYYYEDGIPDSNSGYYVDKDGNMKLKYNLNGNLLIGFVISIIVTAIVIGVLVAKNRMVKKATKASDYLDKESINYSVKEDKFVSTHTSTVKISSDSNSSGGGRSAGSSTSVGSSGRSHGGGGRSF